MEGIVHRSVEVNGIKMHVAEKGEGPVVLLLHGFPDLWYSWRHQIAFLGSHGYRAVAPDLRGYGDTEAPAATSSYTCFDIVGDIVALIDSLGVDQVFLVGHDWGAIISWFLCMFRPEKIMAFVCLSVPPFPYNARNPKSKPIHYLRDLYGDDYYVCRFQEPGKMEAEFAEVDTSYLMKNILTTRKLGPPIFPKGEYGTGYNPNTPDNLPSWLTQEDLDYYVSKFQNTGFTGPLNYYRNIDRNWELTAPWSGVRISVAVRFITGDQDLVYTHVGMKEYIHGDAFRKDVPNLEQVFVQKGVAHYNNQEASQHTTDLIYDFINKF